MKTKLLIIGAGPAGYTAAIYASRAGLQPLLVEGFTPGGQLTQTSVIENFPGFAQGQNANQLMLDMRAQAQRFGCQIVMGEIVKIDYQKRPFVATASGGEQIEADALILATGARARRLGIADEARYVGAGVSTCATCDGFFFRGKRVAIVGGGDTAAEEALYLAALAQQVYMIVRRNELRAQLVLQQRIAENPKIEVLFGEQVVALSGTPRLQQVTLLSTQGAERTLDLDGLFLAIGHEPNNTLALGNLDLDVEGYIQIQNPTTATNIEGVFACGDVCDPRYRQAITAAASGCKAATDAERWLREKGE